MEAEIRFGGELTAEGKLRGAEPLLQEADAIGHHPPVHLLPWQLAEAESALGGCLAALGRTSAAPPCSKEIQLVCECTLARCYPEKRHWHVLRRALSATWRACRS